MEVVHDRREAEGEEDDQNENRSDEEKDDGDGAGGMVAAKVGFGDAGDDGHQDDGEEGADVEDQQLLFERPGEGEEKKDDDAEEDVCASCGPGLLLVRGQVREDSGQLVLLSGC
jgi:hypothetical protein